MTTARFALTYRGQGPMPPADLAFLGERTAIVDQSRSSLLVADTSCHLRTVLRQLPNWSYRSERFYHSFSDHA